MKKRGLLIVVSGFAGSGKGTLMKRLTGDYDNYALSVPKNMIYYQDMVKHSIFQHTPL